LSDSAEETTVTYAPGPPFPIGSRWRVLPAPDDRLPGTFDQDVYVEVLHRYHDAGCPDDGTVSFTLHAFLRAMGRRVDGRTYEQLRGALSRLERTVLESTVAYFVAESPATESAMESAAETGSGQRARGHFVDERLTLFSAVAIERRRSTDRDQLALFPILASNEPGEARVTLAPQVRANIEAGYTTTLSSARYFGLPSPTARRLYRLLAAVQADAGSPRDSARPVVELATSDSKPGASDEADESPSAEPVDDPPITESITEKKGEKKGGVPASTTRLPRGGFVWNVALDALAEQLPLSQHYPSHLQRVLEPAHAMLKAAGVVRDATIRQQRRAWVVHYELP
jgi:hypothetical protein